MVFRSERQTPARQPARHFARVLVEAGPFDARARPRELGLVLRVVFADAARSQRFQRAFGALARFDARRSEKDDRVLDFLVLEAAERFEIFRQNPKGAALFALEKLRIQICERLLRHNATLSSRYDESFNDDREQCLNQPPRRSPPSMSRSSSPRRSPGS